LGVAARAAHYLHKANIVVHRAGSHTLRHTCVQRLVDAGWSLKQIGDYVGHRSAASTEIYSKSRSMRCARLPVAMERKSYEIKMDWFSQPA